jgi:hypothetical protein
MAYSGAEDHEQQGDVGDARVCHTELVGVPPSVDRRQAARATAGMPSCVAKQVTRPVRNREAPVTEPQLV